MRTNLLFVYGTLRKDQNSGKNRYLAEGAELIGTGYIRGRLFEVGGYPGLILSNQGYSVKGEIYRMKNPGELLPVLDEYEECSRHFKKPREYKRKKLSIETDDHKNLKCWIYIYNRYTEGLEEILSGDYCDKPSG